MGGGSAGLHYYGKLSACGTWASRGIALRGGGGFYKGSQKVFMRVSEKTSENSERLGRHVRLGIEPGTSRLPDLSAEPLCHWWDREGKGITLDILYEKKNNLLELFDTFTETKLLCSIVVNFIRDR